MFFKWLEGFRAMSSAAAEGKKASEAFLAIKKAEVAAAEAAAAAEASAAAEAAAEAEAEAAADEAAAAPTAEGEAPPQRCCLIIKSIGVCTVANTL